MKTITKIRATMVIAPIIAILVFGLGALALYWLFISGMPIWKQGLIGIAAVKGIGDIGISQIEKMQEFITKVQCGEIRD